MSERGHFGSAPEGLPLTAEETAALPEGTPVTVIWSGGNGPHDYVIAVDEWGVERYAWDGKTPAMRFYNPLTFVGQKRFHTRVWVSSPAPQTNPEGTQR